MRTLVIGDLHLDDKIIGYLGAQLGTINAIIEDANPDEIIFLGDVFMHRSPSPRVLVALKSYLDCWKKKSLIHIIRGNHDSANKSDDGLTALKVYVDTSIKVWSSFGEYNGKYFIPHYENEKTIRECLSLCPPDSKVFGHFGYYGCLNSVGDADFTLSLTDFKCKTYLGHIHNFKQDGLVTVLGTPYSTNFGEAGTKGYYLILHESQDEEYKEVSFGPRHIVASLDYVKENRDFISDASWLTILRINLLPGESVSEIPDDLNVGHLDIKVVPSFSEEDSLSTYTPNSNITSINDKVIEDYIDNCDIASTLTKDKLMWGLSLLRGKVNED